MGKVKMQQRNYPLIITLEFEQSAKDYFNNLRSQYFPKHANYLDAHLTLFHNLPSNDSFVINNLLSYSKRDSFSLEVSRLVNFGKGVAFQLQSEELMDMHQEMQAILNPFLKRQDMKPLWPHITVQNKVTAFKAQSTLELLDTHFKPFHVRAIGLGVWYYIGGPWRPAHFMPFEK